MTDVTCEQFKLLIQQQSSHAVCSFCTVHSSKLTLLSYDKLNSEGVWFLKGRSKRVSEADNQHGHFVMNVIQIFMFAFNVMLLLTVLLRNIKGSYSVWNIHLYVPLNLFCNVGRTSFLFFTLLFPQTSFLNTRIDVSPDTFHTVGPLTSW